MEEPTSSFCVFSCDTKLVSSERSFFMGSNRPAWIRNVVTIIFGLGLQWTYPWNTQLRRRPRCQQQKSSPLCVSLCSAVVLKSIWSLFEIIYLAFGGREINNRRLRWKSENHHFILFNLFLFIFYFFIKTHYTHFILFEFLLKTCLPPPTTMWFTIVYIYIPRGSPYLDLDPILVS